MFSLYVGLLRPAACLPPELGSRTGERRSGADDASGREPESELWTVGLYLISIPCGYITFSTGAFVQPRHLYANPVKGVRQWVYSLEHVLRLGSGVQDDFRCINIIRLTAVLYLLLVFLYPSPSFSVPLQTVACLSGPTRTLCKGPCQNDSINRR